MDFQALKHPYLYENVNIFSKKFDPYSLKTQTIPSISAVSPYLSIGDSTNEGNNLIS